MSKCVFLTTQYFFISILSNPVNYNDLRQSKPNTVLDKKKRRTVKLYLALQMLEKHLLNVFDPISRSDFYTTASLTLGRYIIKWF